MRTLLIGIGNEARGDDGLGPRLAERIEALGLTDVRVIVDYQLGVEHAADLAMADEVYFLDAAVDPDQAPFRLSVLEPEPGLEFTSHALAPARVLHLATELFRARPRAWVFTVGGTAFEPFVETLSAAAEAHLDAATSALLARLADPDRG